MTRCRQCLCWIILNDRARSWKIMQRLTVNCRSTRGWFFEQRMTILMTIVPCALTPLQGRDRGISREAPRSTQGSPLSTDPAQRQWQNFGNGMDQRASTLLSRLLNAFHSVEALRLCTAPEHKVWFLWCIALHSTIVELVYRVEHG